MIREMMSISDRPNQLSHQSIYIKNMIAVHLGIPHELSFDLYTGCLQKELIEKPVEELLRVFYSHINPSLIAEHLVSSFNRLPEGRSKNNFYNGFNEFGIKAEELWELDEAEYHPILTKSGAIKLLMAMGILKT